MAVIDKNGNWHGTAGQHVYRTIGTTPVVQIKPGKVKQTAATRESALEFGLASNTARNIRQMMWAAYHTPDRGMANRLTYSILRCIGKSEKMRGERDIHDGDIGQLRGFQFNKNSPLSEVLAVRPQVGITEEGTLHVRIPAFNAWHDIKCPLSAYMGLNLRIMATAFHFRSEYYEYLGYKDVWMNKGQDVPEQQWTLEKELPAGSLVLVTVSLTAGSRSGFGEETANNRDWSPAEIVEVFQVPQGDAPVLEGETRELSPEEAAGRNLVEWIDDTLCRQPLGYQGKRYFGKIQLLRDKLSVYERKKMEDQAKRKARSRSSDAQGFAELKLPVGKMKFK